ncbi:MAG TPA: 50S ribosomal protein L9, partial [Nitrospirae bacterium]|nr:50S ribosomal protein L9 [Nitrospirota bacterium]
MKVIIKEDIENLGNMGDIVNVKDGYARNYLIPKNLAVGANPRNIKKFEHYRRIIQEKANTSRNSAQILAEKLSSKPMFIKAKASEKDK